MSEPKPVVRQNLITKLSEVMERVKYVPKRGRNEFHKYDYAMEADIVASIRVELASRHVMLIPAVLTVSREMINEKGSFLTTLRILFTFHDGDSGETLSADWMGAGADREDKGLYKAMTGAEKYFLLKTFLIPTGDDPEATEDEPPVRRRGRQSAADAKPTATPTDDPLITGTQVSRLRDLMHSHGVNMVEFKAWVQQTYGYKQASDIHRRNYDAVVAYVMAGGDKGAEQGKA